MNAARWQHILDPQNSNFWAPAAHTKIIAKVTISTLQLLLFSDAPLELLEDRLI